MPLNVDDVTMEQIRAQLPPYLLEQLEMRRDRVSDADNREWLAINGVILAAPEGGAGKAQMFLYVREPGNEAKRTPQTPSAIKKAQPKPVAKTPAKRSHKAKA